MDHLLPFLNYIIEQLKNNFYEIKFIIKTYIRKFFKQFYLFININIILIRFYYLVGFVTKYIVFNINGVYL